MKKINKNKQLLLIGVALLLVTVASTYAWWTASKTVEQKITMGNLKIEASFDEDDLSDFEPGLSTTIEGIIKNSGSIDAMVRVDNDSDITFAYSDDNLTEIPEASRQPETLNSENININIQPENNDYSGSTTVFWLQDASGNKYLLMTPGSEIKVNVNVDFKGKEMTNKYMKSVIDVKAKIDATQVLEGAGQDVWGISFENDLSDVPDSNSRMSARNTSSQSGYHYLMTLLERGK